MDEQQKHLGFFTLLTIILVEGFVTIAVEIITIRQLITVVGNSVIITSLIIGIFLLFLALGYYQGGRYRENYRSVLLKNFTWSAILLGIGLSYTFVQLLFFMLFKVVTPNALITLTVYLLLITAPLVYFLGQTVPITTNLFRYEQHVGSISGKVLCISTFGSFLGSVLTTLLLMNFLGVAWTIFLNFALLVFLIVLLSDLSIEYLRPMSLLVAAFFIFFLNVMMEYQLFVKTNNYGDYQIIYNVNNFPPNIGTLLTINNAPSSFRTADNKGFEYIELIKKILFKDLGFINKNILVLGAGGFSLSAESTHNNNFLYVDVDADLPSIAKSGFIKEIKGQFIAKDARQFLLHTKQRFDAVVTDVYSAHYTIPFHLLTKEYFQNIQRVLNPNGVAIFNIIANPMFHDNYSKRVDNTLRFVFKNCMSIPIKYINGPTNIVYICTARPNNDTTLYTDNINKSMIDIFHNK